MDKKSQQNDSASFEDAQDGEDQFEDCPDDQNSQEPNSPDKKITETNNKGKFLNSIEKVYNFQKNGASNYSFVFQIQTTSCRKVIRAAITTNKTCIRWICQTKKT